MTNFETFARTVPLFLRQLGPMGPLHLSTGPEILFSCQCDNQVGNSPQAKYTNSPTDKINGSFPLLEFLVHLLEVRSKTRSIIAK